MKFATFNFTRVRIRAVILLFTYMISFATYPDSASAVIVDKPFCADNHINYVSCGSECSSGSTPTSGSTTQGDGGGCGEKKGDSQINKDLIWTYFNNKFKEAGYSPEEAEKATAGIMGNWERESGFNPDRHNAPNPGSGCSGAAGPITGTVGYGIAQWCGDRQKALKDFAGAQDPSCLGVQLEFTWQEMNSRNLVKAMKGVSASEAAHIFNLGGNGAQGFEVGQDDSIRMSNADKQYSAYTGKDPGKISALGASSSEANGCNPASSPASGSIADVANQMGEWGAKFNACYVYGGGHGQDTEWLKQAIAHNFAGDFAVDCSAFVRAVIYQATGADPGQFNTNSMCADSSKFEKIPRNQAQPGDFSIDCENHVEVITGVNGDGTFKTVGSHKTGCGAGYGASPGSYQGTESYVLRYKG